MNRFNTYDQFLNEGIDPLNHLTQEQVDWCNKHIKQKWGVNSEGEVTVTKNLEFKDRSFDRFPVQFAPVNGSFYCSHCPNLVSLEGTPQSVNGNFYCYNCPNLVSLEGAPQSVGGGFSCGGCPKLPHWETDLIEDYMKNHRTWEEVHSKLHKESYRRAAQTGLI